MRWFSSGSKGVQRPIRGPREFPVEYHKLLFEIRLEKRKRNGASSSGPTCRWILAVATASLLAGAGLLAGAPKPQPAAVPVPQSAPALPTALAPLQLDGAAALNHLTQVIAWYRRSTLGTQLAGLPQDPIYQDNTQTLGTQVVQLAFQSARAETTLIAAQQKSRATAQAGSVTQQQNLVRLQAKTAAQIGQLQGQVDHLNGQIGNAPAGRRSNLIAQRDDLQGQLELQKALLDTIQKMASFVETNSETIGGLEGGINQLARTIPELLDSSAAAQKPATSANQAKPSLPISGGLISEAMALYDYLSAVHQLNGVIKDTQATREVADHLRLSLRDALQATIQQSQALASQPPATSPQQLQGEQQAFKDLTERFKQISGALLPISQEMILFNESKANDSEWRNAIARQSRQALRSVLLRGFGIALALGLILALSEVWRRITFRYVTEHPRRQQFLVLRRVAIGLLIAIVLTLGFVSDFSSLATFAGFLTAGIAVGLQAVLLSFAAYFFIIGRYGIRVGDRVSIAGITGDVVDIGLVRFYLMELAGTGLDFSPTGRIVVFSNAVLFQPSTPLFKQIPGADYAWHELVVLIVPEGNHQAAQDKLVAAVDAVYAGYREEIERQHASIEGRVDILVAAPLPQVRLRFADAGLEVLVRYPVELRKAPKMDEEMTRKVLELIETDPELKAAIAGTPKIRAAIRG